MFLDFVYLIISFVAGVINIINLGALPSTGGAAFLQTSKRVYFWSFYFRGFITVKTPELFSLYNLHCEFYMRPKGDLFE